MKLDNIDIYAIEDVLREFLSNQIIDEKSNGLLIRLADTLPNSYTRRRMYIIEYPEKDINKILNRWSEYALDNIIENYDLLKLFTIVSIQPLKIPNVKDFLIKYSGHTIVPEDLIKKVTTAIIDNMHNHLLEYYMDEYHPEIDIANSEEEYDIDLEEVYETFPLVQVYVPIKEVNSNETFYLNGTIRSTSVYVDIINEIRLTLDFDDLAEQLELKEDEIIYKYIPKEGTKLWNHELHNNIKLENFEIITEINLLAI